MTGPIKHFAIRHWPRLPINLLNPLFYLIVSDSCFIFWAALLRHSDNAFRLFIRILLVDNLGWFQLWINTFPENWRLNNASGKREKICMLTWWFGLLCHKIFLAHIVETNEEGEGNLHCDLMVWSALVTPRASINRVACPPQRDCLGGDTDLMSSLLSDWPNHLSTDQNIKSWKKV